MCVCVCVCVNVCVCVCLFSSPVNAQLRDEEAQTRAQELASLQATMRESEMAAQSGLKKQTDVVRFNHPT